MARKDILPGYLSQQAWRDLCDAIDVVFASRVDNPIKNLGKLRRPTLLGPTASAKIENHELLSVTDDLDYFEKEVLLKQINSSGLVVTQQNYFSQQELSRLFRNLPRFWYSKGTSNVADFLSYIFNMPISIVNLWTEDYVTFLPEGDPGIGTSIYDSGTWFPTSHVTIDIFGDDLPGGIPLELFAKLIEEVINYTLVPSYNLSVPEIWLSTASGNQLDVVLGVYNHEYEVAGNFAITGVDETSARGGGGFESMGAVVIAGSGGTGYSLPSLPTASFSASTTSGAAPLSVTFTNTSTGTFFGSAWDFNGDGVTDSVAFSPTYVFTTPGVFLAQLSVFNAAGADYFSLYITVT